MRKILVNWKEGRKKNRTKTRWDKEETNNNMVVLNTIISTITLHVNGLIISINRHCYTEIYQLQKYQLHAAYNLTIKTKVKSIYM